MIMKNFFLLMTVVVITTLTSSCRKTYDCTATNDSGATKVFQCENCTSKDKKDYEQAILDAGWASATCDKE
jgi:hypothetical protein